MNMERITSNKLLQELCDEFYEEYVNTKNSLTLVNCANFNEEIRLCEIACHVGQKDYFEYRRFKSSAIFVLPKKDGESRYLEVVGDSIELCYDGYKYTNTPSTDKDRKKYQILNKLTVDLEKLFNLYNLPKNSISANFSKYEPLFKNTEKKLVIKQIVDELNKLDYSSLQVCLQEIQVTTYIKDLKEKFKNLGEYNIDSKNVRYKCVLCPKSFWNKWYEFSSSQKDKIKKLGVIPFKNENNKWCLMIYDN